MIHANGQWKSKKALKEAANPGICQTEPPAHTVCTTHGRPVLDGYTCRRGRGVSVDAFSNPSLFGGDVPTNGTFAVVGPSAYERRWYATVTAKDGRVIKVR